MGRGTLHGRAPHPRPRLLPREPKGPLRRHAIRRRRQQPTRPIRPPVQARQMVSLCAINNSNHAEIHTANLNSPAPRNRPARRRIYRLARGAGGLRLRIGQAFHRLRDGVQELLLFHLGRVCARALQSRRSVGRRKPHPRTPSPVATAVREGPRSRVHRLEHSGAASAACHTPFQISGSPKGEAPNEAVQISGTSHGKVTPAMGPDLSQ